MTDTKLFVGEVTFRFIVEADSEEDALTYARENIGEKNFNDVLHYKLGSLKIAETLPQVIKATKKKGE